MKTLEEILLENENIYQWDDGTVDLCFYDKETPFIRQINSTICLRCETPIAQDNEHKVQMITEYVKGIKLTCTQCGLPYFLHHHVRMDSV